MKLKSRTQKYYLMKYNIKIQLNLSIVNNFTSNLCVLLF